MKFRSPLVNWHIEKKQIIVHYIKQRKLIFVKVLAKFISFIDAKQRRIELIKAIILFSGRVWIVCIFYRNLEYYQYKSIFK
jgi:hypothetical protein